MLGREAAPLAPTPIRKAQTPRERCCASSSSTRLPRPAILDRDLFDAVQAKLDDQLTNYTATRQIRGSADRPHLRRSWQSDESEPMPASRASGKREAVSEHLSESQSTGEMPI
jgi:hypothetical protein